MNRNLMLGILVLVSIIPVITPSLATSELIREQNMGRINSGRWTGYFALGGMIIAMILGFPQIRRFITANSRVTATGLMQAHRTISFIVVFIALVHGLQLWDVSFNPNETAIGIGLAVLCFMTMVIAMIGGRHFNIILRKIGRKKAILLQQITYTGLIFGILHTKIDGTWTNQYPILFYILASIMIILLVTRGAIALNHRNKRAIPGQRQRIAFVRLMGKTLPTNL